MRDTTTTARERFREFRRRRADERAWTPSSVEQVPRTAIGPLPSTLDIPKPRRRGRRPRIEPLPVRSLLIAAGVIVVGLALWAYLWSMTRVHADLLGIEDGAAMTPDEAVGIVFEIEVSPSGRLTDATLVFDGEDVLSQAKIQGDTIVWNPGPLTEGEHVLALTVPRPMFGDAELDWEFAVDGTPPRIDVPPYLPPRGMDDPVEIEGSVEGAETLLVNGEEQDLDDDGSFSLSFERPPPGPIELEATDAAGNRRRATVFAPIEFPDDVHGVHVTAAAWDNATLRQGILDLIDAGVVNTVVLTLKDEGGLVGHVTKVPMARRVGANEDLYDLKKQVDFLHDLGARVTGRIVAFRDPIFADWAWSSGRKDLVLQTPEGDRYGLYGGGFTNFSADEVRKYNLDLATEAVEAGVDDILWDYIRRPDGFLEEMVIPGLEGSPTDSVTEFLAQSHEAVRRLGAVQGASVFGVAATRPEQIAQDILAMASHTDYIAPMLYPSHWNPGEYGVSDPEAEPYEIIKRSLRDFQQQVQRTGRPLVPWLQYFSLRVTYTEREVQAQMRAAREMGHDGWMMWDPAVTYSADTLRVD